MLNKQYELGSPVMLVPDTNMTGDPRVVARVT